MVIDMKDALLLPTQGYIILFHFDPPYKHAKHCFDWAVSPHDRINEHYLGKSRGPVLVKQAVEAGSVLKVGRVRKGTRIGMLALRSGGNATRLCRLCQIDKKMSWQDGYLEELLQRSIERLRRLLNVEGCVDFVGRNIGDGVRAGKFAVRTASGR